MRRAGKALLLASLILAAAAAALSFYNFRLEQKAGAASGHVLENWDKLPVTEHIDTGMAERTDGASSYIGVLSIPKLSVSLPVNRDLTERLLETALCRYQGSIHSGGLIIAGHNYRNQFGRLYKLEAGDEILLTDALGAEHRYAVTRKETVAGTDIHAMEGGDWDLTLFTCTYGGRNRMAIRCSRTGQ